jgi:hypothetical protein
MPFFFAALRLGEKRLSTNRPESVFIRGDFDFPARRRI